MTPAASATSLGPSAGGTGTWAKASSFGSARASAAPPFPLHPARGAARQRPKSSAAGRGSEARVIGRRMPHPRAVGQDRGLVYRPGVPTPIQPALAAAALALAGCAVHVATPPSALPPVPADAAPIAATRAAVEQALTAEVAKYKLPSLAFGVVTRGGLVYFIGLGTREGGGGAVTPDTVYRIGSITKTFSGLALLQLRDAGKLDLDNPVVKYLPELATARYPTQDSGPIRIRHLVTHTSGLPRLGSLQYGPGHEVDRKDLRDAAASAVLEFAPGTRSQYSNLAMALAGPIIARAGGEPYRAYLTEHILAPLGMTHTVWDREAVPPDLLAQGWAKEKSGEFSAAGSHWHLGAAEAMGGLYSSVADMSRYVAFQLQAWPARDGAEAGPVQRSSVRESQMVAGFGKGGGEGFGVNWIVKNEPALGGHVVFHNGMTEGYHAVVWMLPERGLAVIALGPATQDLDGIAHRALASIAAATHPEPALGAPARAAVARLRELVAAADPAAVADAFAPSFLEAVGAAKVLSILTSVRDEGGRCTSARVFKADPPTFAEVDLTCERASWHVKVSAEPAAPHRIVGLLITPAQP